MPRRMEWRTGRKTKDFEELYAQPDLMDGKWFAPVFNTYVVVTDLKEASGLRGVTMFEIGEGHDWTDDRVDSGLRVAGHDEDTREEVMNVVRAVRDTHANFYRLARKAQENILIAAEAMFAGSGFRDVTNRVLVVDSASEYASDDGQEELNWLRQDRIDVVEDPKRGVKDLLEDWGVINAS